MERLRMYRRGPMRWKLKEVGGVKKVVIRGGECRPISGRAKASTTRMEFEVEATLCGVGFGSVVLQVRRKRKRVGFMNPINYFYPRVS
ncbi:hypothetical protein Acr_00g0063360 [Actinidia rufa]|uniref:Uncharacterized protein n=1 Tax=Actinidia rufa TaxID=165716 RepID=A0A7J0DPF9_9ERIC|nr:hypothetical protein Acr_00g0063360 [Actinidia rufa]